MAFEDTDRVFWWPKVADTVIEARRCLAFASPWLVPDVGARDTRTDILLR
jgi:hypothetical protein